MTAADSQLPDFPRPTVFLSYAREDRAAVQLIRDALPGFGLEVWYDESDLLGGDAWDQKIRRQIRECHYFMPVISAHTDARREGYFRREWRLAVERTLDMSDDSVFLVPVVIDDTSEAHARVPEKFRAVQWLRLPGGQPTATLESFCRRLVRGESEAPPAQATVDGSRAKSRPIPARPELPAFPREEPGQKARFWLQVAGWGFQSAWVGFRRFPKWLRILVYVWIGILILQWGATSSHHATSHSSTTQIVHLAQLARIAQSLKSGPQNPVTTDAAKLIEQIAKPTPQNAQSASSTQASVLAIPFDVPPSDTQARRFAGAVFQKLYGKLLLTPFVHVSMMGIPLPVADSAAAQEQARAHHSTYVVFGGLDGRAPTQTLTVKIAAATGDSVSWSKSYPLAGAHPAQIAADAAAEVSKLQSECAARPADCAPSSHPHRHPPAAKRAGTSPH